MGCRARPPPAKFSQRSWPKSWWYYDFNGFSCWTHSVSGCQVVLGWLASGWYSQKLEDGFGCMIESILWMQMWSNWQARRLAKHTFLSPYFCWYLLIGFENPCRCMFYKFQHRFHHVPPHKFQGNSSHWGTIQLLSLLWLQFRTSNHLWKFGT